MAATIKITCKKCGREFSIRHPQKAGTFQVKCPACGEAMRIAIKGQASPNAAPQNQAASAAAQRQATPPPQQSRATRRFNVDECDEIGTQLSIAKIVTPDGMAYQLHVGDNTIGRRNDSAPSDIQLDGDPTISRRSISVNVAITAKGVVYTLSVLNATNPIYVNQRPYYKDQRVLISVGDTIQLGQKRLVLYE